MILYAAFYDICDYCLIHIYFIWCTHVYLYYDIDIRYLLNILDISPITKSYENFQTDIFAIVDI